jgi:hypothetical protein
MKCKKMLISKAPQILTSGAVLGVIATTLVAIKNDRKARVITDEIDTEIYNSQHLLDRTVKDTIKSTWHCYIPTLLIGGATIACVIKSHNVSTKRSIALSGLALLTENRFSKYREKVAEILGDKKQTEIKDSLAKDVVSKASTVSFSPNNVDLLKTTHGDVICYDPYSARYFTSSVEYIKRILNDLGRDMLSEDQVCINQVYDMLGLLPTTIGDFLIWEIAEGMIEPEFSSQLTEDGKPCLVVNYVVEPKYRTGF